MYVHHAAPGCLKEPSVPVGLCSMQWVCLVVCGEHTHLLKLGHSISCDCSCLLLSAQCSVCSCQDLAAGFRVISLLGWFGPITWAVALSYSAAYVHVLLSCATCTATTSLHVHSLSFRTESLQYSCSALTFQGRAWSATGTEKTPFSLLLCGSWPRVFFPLIKAQIVTEILLLCFPPLHAHPLAGGPFQFQLQPAARLWHCVGAWWCRECCSTWELLPIRVPPVSSVCATVLQIRVKPFWLTLLCLLGSRVMFCGPGSLSHVFPLQVLSLSHRVLALKSFQLPAAPSDVYCWEPAAPSPDSTKAAAVAASGALAHGAPLAGSWGPAVAQCLCLKAALAAALQPENGCLQ